MRPYHLVQVSESDLKAALENGGLIPTCKLEPVDELFTRQEMDEDSLHKYVKTHGGATLVSVTKDGHTHEAESVCSDSDPFCYHSGLVKALGRAMGKFNECVCPESKHENCCKESQQPTLG